VTPDDERTAAPPTHAEFEQMVRDALATIPQELFDQISNVEIVIDDDPPEDPRILGLYQGVPLTQRTRWTTNLPDKITIYRSQLERFYGPDREVLEREVRRVVLHELAHHFGISDDRLVEIDRY
jgi:predicted Zn-dependent protease with MMP-like domain